ncbi:hypothetical protein BDM02DRAFT_2862728 [Thelephora ganbajun]|uniref:Uncharacterized protein n=1 Tax=Thelephora ganbajun TaxID=370292 RepID=A0ACB6ZC11_THEGA|nr:hypothetical protein BDM02DRAFT_2862728 [Thelephora ganbajun]
MRGYAITLYPPWSVSSDPLLFRIFPPPTSLHSFSLSFVLLSGICTLFECTDTPHWIVETPTTDGPTNYIICIYTKDMWA